MKKIKIFLASSIVEFSSERMVLENFIRNISDKFEENYNVKIQPLLCENFDDAYSVARKQEEYNEKIRESEFCFFIFFTKVGEYTHEEFNVAREQFEKTGSPKIYTYFKVIEEGKGEDSLYAFMDELDKVFGHYYGTFSHIDTIKLRILLSLSLKEMDFLEIKADNGKCVVDGTEVMSLDNVAEFSNNKELKKLTDELERVEEEYFELKPLYEKGNNDEAFYKRYSAIASRRQYLIDEIEELQRLIFKVSLRMVEDDTHGTVTKRQKSAYRLFEQGDYEGCMSVLNSEDIDSDFLRDMKRLEEQKIAVCQKYIREHKTAIDILTSMKGYDKRFEEIEERYKKIIPYIMEFKIETQVAIDYVSYLNDQGKDNIALPIAEQLVNICEDEVKQASVFNLLGIIYYNLNKASKAESFYLRAIAIYEKLVDVSPERYSPDLAMSYNNAGVFYDEQGQINKAEGFYLKTINIREKLAGVNPERYSGSLARSYNNAGLFYNDQGQVSKAEGFYLKAINIREKLVDVNPQRYSGDLADSYNSTGAFYHQHGQANKAEGFYLKAIKLREKLVDVNPKMFSLDLADSYNNAGIFYKDQGKADKAEGFYLKAIAIYEKLVDVNSERFSGDLADSYNNAGIFYGNQGQANKAKGFYLKAIAIYEKLVDVSPKRYSPNLAMSYYNYAIFTKEDNMFKKALELARIRPDHPMCKIIISRFE